ncbi:MAG TPA: PCRF domain-containing protein, partial [Candidatus Dormibacteraeota bacterium]
MFEQLDAVRQRYQAIGERLADPATHSDLKELQRLGKEQAQLRDLVQLYEAYRRAEQGMAEARELAEHERDPEMQAYARQEFEKQQAERDRLEQELKLALVPKDPNDEKDVIVEIRQAVGGEEAALFAADLFRMYSRYAESRRWKVDIVSESLTERGGFKEVIFEVRGRGAYSRLKFESGPH